MISLHVNPLSAQWQWANSPATSVYRKFAGTSSPLCRVSLHAKGLGMFSCRPLAPAQQGTAGRRDCKRRWMCLCVYNISVNL